MGVTNMSTPRQNSTLKLKQSKKSVQKIPSIDEKLAGEKVEPAVETVDNSAEDEFDKSMGFLESLIHGAQQPLMADAKSESNRSQESLTLEQFIFRETKSVKANDKVHDWFCRNDKTLNCQSKNSSFIASNNPTARLMSIPHLDLVCQG